MRATRTSFRSAYEAFVSPFAAWAALLAVVQAAERCVLLVAVLELARTFALRALVGAGALGAVFALRGAVRAHLRRGVRQSVLERASRAVLEADPLQMPVFGQDPEVTIFEGLYDAEAVVADILPSLAGDAVAGVILAVVIAGAVPPVLAAAAGGLLVVAGAFVALARRFASRALQRGQRAYLPVVETVVLAVGARTELVASGRTGEFLADLRTAIRHWAAVSRRAERVSALGGRAPVVAVALGVPLAVVVLRVGRGTMAQGDLANLAVLATLVPVFAGVARGVLEATRVTSRLAPLMALLDAPLLPTGGGAAVPRRVLPIALRAVSFGYPGGSHDVLSSLDVAWMPGELLVLAGPNGCGKSTFLRLLLGLARPTAGDIEVGGVPLFDLDLAAWRRRVAYLPQRPFLPDRANVRDAVRLVARDASDDAIERALADVDLLAALRLERPSAPLEVRVGTLSMGQKQRLALARVLAQGGDILLLDEPDANLDAAGIELVARLVRTLAKTRQVAVAAHTKALVDAADRVVTLTAA